MNSKRIFSTLAAISLAGLGLASVNVASAAVILNAGNADCYGKVSPPSEPAVVAAFKADCASGDVSELYKSDFVEGVAIGTDSGPYAASYTTTFGGFKETMEDPTTADIVYQLGQLAIAGYDKIFLLAKDGAHDPSYYGWNISGWNGTETLSVTAWDEVKGSISHVSIWGERGAKVPEPGPIGLLGAGLIALYWVRRRIAVR